MNPPPNATIDKPAIGAAVTAERLTLCDLLDTLTPDDWQIAVPLRTAGPCRTSSPTSRSATRDTVWDLVKGAIRGTRQLRPHERRHGSRSRSAVRSTRAHRTTQGDRRFDTPRATQQPTRSPRRRPRARPGHRPTPRTDPPHATRARLPALDHAVNSRWYGGSKRFNNVTLIATDTDWTPGRAARSPRHRGRPALDGNRSSRRPEPTLRPGRRSADSPTRIDLTAPSTPTSAVETASLTTRGTSSPTSMTDGGLTPAGRRDEYPPPRYPPTQCSIEHHGRALMPCPMEAVPRAPLPHVRCRRLRPTESRSMEFRLAR